MRYVRFYEEFTNKRRGESAGTVIALIPENRCPDGSREAVGALFDQPNSPVASTSVSDGYLFKNCKRVSETRAREVHPNLFEYLDRD